MNNLMPDRFILGCGCSVIIVDRAPEDSQEEAIIQYCSMHGAGPELYKALNFTKVLLKASILWTSFVDETISPALESAKPEEK